MWHNVSFLFFFKERHNINTSYKGGEWTTEQLNLTMERILFILSHRNIIIKLTLHGYEAGLQKILVFLGFKGLNSKRAQIMDLSNKSF